MHTAFAQKEGPWIHFSPPAGQSNGKYIVLVGGDEAYRSEESLPMLAKILAERHGFRAIVLFAINPETGFIDPNYHQNIPGLQFLAKADMVIIATRFRELPDDQMQYIHNYFVAGKPVIGLRTATHAFHYSRNPNNKYAKYGFKSNQKGWEGGFGKRILGENWVNHHGAGWYTFVKGKGTGIDPKQIFTVGDGLIKISGEEYGCITTNDEYSDYKLIVEFKWGPRTFTPRVDRARDNGILLHSTGVDGGYSGTWMYSIECQIIEGGTGDFLVVGDGTDKFSLTSNVAPKKPGGGNVYMPGGQPLTINKGRVDWFARDPNWKDVLGFRGEKDVEKEVGKWNRMYC
jgi:hypothetical protein